MTFSPTYLPEHAVAAYAQERPSAQRMILEARWAHLQHDATFEHPEAFRSDQVHRLARARLIHLGAFYDILAIRGARDPEVHEAARGLGTNLLAHDGFHLPTTPLSGTDYLRTSYAAMHGHSDLRTPQPVADPAESPQEQLPFEWPPASRMIRTMLWSYTAARTCQHHGRSADDADTQLREHHIARGLLLWNAALLAPADRGSAQAAATAAHHVRDLDGRPRTHDENALQYLLDVYREAHPEEAEQPHDPDCPGGCAGDGVVMVTLTWDDQGGGVFVPVWQEPVDCTEGVPLDHDPACPDCSGHGYTYSRGERHLCLCLRPVHQHT
ncbi:hypothetical protein C9F11_42875 (plasmid) [Streptomyces sp. YIM 121038]|uniref:hypothetical protein n=1 Tax=Streptomyces sp. YIM 121038 TaxID=2136401 RepID=UPI0011105D13|nr:hypothetical protein [Streptomyces sp. YIM 121038]QCX82155.1 hypothetical protein C9F11_42875 [Streptomyces sp. YIM 121038]